MAPSEAYQPNWHVRAISAPGPDTDLSLHVSFDNARFLFGCGEGTQRAFTQKRMSMRGLAGIFIGSGEARSRAGLAGVLMTAADGGISKVDIVGPPDMSHYLSTLRSSVIRDSLTVNMHSYPRSSSSGEAVELFKSANITVHGIALIPESTNEAGPSTRSYQDYDPHSVSFRPSRLSPLDAQKWCDQIVADIFHNGPKARASRRAPPPPPSTQSQGEGSKSPSRRRSSPPSTLANPYVNPDDTICSSIPDTRYPLPLPSKEDVQTQMVYICQAPDVRGKFNVEKANKLGVPKGPARGKLTKGEQIEVDDPSVEGGKRIVKPEDCLVGGGPGSVLVVVNCTEQTKSSLMENTYFHKYQPARSTEIGAESMHVHLIVHRVPESVWDSEDYREWMKAFGDSTQHLIADPVECPDRTVFNSAAWNTLQLSIANSDVFTPPFVTSPHPTSRVDLPPNTSFLLEGSYCRMHPPAPVTVVDNHNKDTPFLISHSEAESARDTIRQDMPEYSHACDEAHTAILADPRSTNSTPSSIGDDITVTTLGTGSAIPSKHRNVSSTLLSIPDVGGILLDAGEGTLGQTKRRFGKEGTTKLFEDLQMIFISHMHADHHLGLNSVLEERFKLGITAPLFLIGPTNIALTLQESASWQHAAPSQQALQNVVFINIQRLGFKIDNRNQPRSRSPSPASDAGKEMDQWEKEGVEDRQSGVRGWPYTNIYGFSPAATHDHWRELRRLMSTLSLKSIWAPVVPHRGRAYGLAIEHTSGWKIVYSGDTKPSEELVTAGQDATLLIHEATLEDDKPEVAAIKGHSTFSQAIEVGKKMKAKHILLNHFSQRYPKLPKLPSAKPKPVTIEESGMNDSAIPSVDQQTEPIISISFDFMSIKIGEMWKMSYYMEPLSLLFVETEEEGEGEDTVLGAVKHDINPTVENVNGGGSEGKSGKDKAKAKNKNSNINNNGKQKKQDNPSDKVSQIKRPASPSNIDDQPQLKRRSTDSSSGIVDEKMDVEI
ncbi:uncharacterized protein L201_006050 [Kwoniella dendrophila CBS 6074]|uniref:ribonuclease Z n=1 Tax=Kwoniella dendrophila CBS 6074 TaxID=1295534 RepID=A0AAX4K162_9TREE